VLVVAIRDKVARGKERKENVNPKTHERKVNPKNNKNIKNADLKNTIGASKQKEMHFPTWAFSAIYATIGTASWKAYFSYLYTNYK